MLVMIDLDNTLADREAAVRRWVAEFCEARSLGPDVAAWLTTMDNDGYADRREVFQQIVERLDPTASVDELLAAYRRRVVELAALCPGAVACLGRLRDAGWTTAIVSNGSSEQQHGKIDALGLRPLVDAVVVSGDLGIKKPDPRIFEAAARVTGCRLSDAWMVGDSPENDVVGPHRLGIATVWLRRGRRWSEPSVEPRLTIDGLDELPALLGSAKPTGPSGERQGEVDDSGR